MDIAMALGYNGAENIGPAEYWRWLSSEGLIGQNAAYRPE